MPRDVDDVIVMLDGRRRFADLPDTDLDIFWGAYLGTPDEILVSGDLPAVRDEIVRRRAEARARKGWIMDTYLLPSPLKMSHTRSGPEMSVPPVTVAHAGIHPVER